MGKSIAYTDEVHPPPGSVLFRSAFVDHLAQRAFDLGKGRVESGAARVDHDIPLRPEFGAVETEGFAETALKAITHHGPANGSGNRKTQTRAGSS